MRKCSSGGGRVCLFPLSILPYPVRSWGPLSTGGCTRETPSIPSGMWCLLSINISFKKKPNQKNRQKEITLKSKKYNLFSADFPPSFSTALLGKTAQPVPRTDQTHQTFIHQNHMLWPSEWQYLMGFSCRTIWQGHNSSHHCWHSVGTIHSGRVKMGLMKDCSGVILSFSIEIKQLQATAFHTSVYRVSLGFLVPDLEYLKERFSKGRLSATPT